MKYDATMEGRARRVVPMWPQSIRSNFVVPALTGIYLGVMLAVVVAVPFSVIVQAIWPDTLIRDSFWTPFLIFMSVFAAAGFVWRTGWIDKMSIATEDVRKMHGEPETQMAFPEPHPPILLSTYANKQIAESEKRDKEKERFASFVRSCETDTSARYWQSRESRYVEYRNALIGAGWAEWRDEKNPKAGWMLTEDAEKIIEKMNALPHPEHDVE